MKELTPKKNNILKLSGSSYEIGIKHGKEAREKVHNSLQTYEKMFKEYTATSWDKACKKALLHVKAIEEYNSSYLEEMEGLAKGAGVTFEDILALNARSEIALITSPDGCTSFALTKPKTTNTWLAQNWDWKDAQNDSLIHLEIEQRNLPSLQMVTEAGIIGKIGCNSAGIGVCLNALITDTWQPKVPIHLVLRAILESNSMEEAVSKVSNNQMASPAHFLIASKSEETISMEVSPVYTSQIKPIKGILVHTNHICSMEMKKNIKEDILPDSYNRLSTITKQVESLNEIIEKEDLFQVLSNHDNYPNSICRHESPEQTAPKKMETVFSIVMNLSSNELSWIDGKPCEHL